ncbi:MAG: histidine kinase [Burkholderiales bacterium]|nr:histidine kinase [Burkholderiales bacterium]
MRGWRCQGLGRILGFWLLVWGCASAHAEVLTQAHATVTVGGVVTRQDVQLPYHWDRVHHGKEGEAVFEIAFAAPETLHEPYGLFLHRVGSTAEVRLNGNMLARFGDVHQPNGDDYAKAPQYVAIAEQLLGAHNVLQVRIRADGGRRGGLSALEVGPHSAVYPHFNAAYTRRVLVSVVVAIFSFLMGGAALALWYTQVDPAVPQSRGRDGIYLTAGLGELCWALRVGDFAWAQPPVVWPLWGGVMTVAFAGWFCCMGLFCQRVAGWDQLPSMRGVRRVLAALFGGSIVASVLSFGLQQTVYITVWLACANVLFMVYAGVFLVGALRQRERTWQVLAVVGALNVVMGLHDWVAIRISNHYDSDAWIRYSSVLFGLVLGYVVLTRFRTATAQARELLATLATRVADKEAELRASYAQLEALAREQARTAERTRILRDMHDGVGAHISSALQLLQSERENSRRGVRTEVLQTLRDAMDQLKLSIDSMHLPPGDVTALLANLRYRLEPRFAAMGMELQWDVDLLPIVPRLDFEAMRQLQFMLFEAFSNVLQHARATVLRVQAHAADGILIRVVDDGAGFDAQGVQGKGLVSMRQRATALGAELRVSSQPGETVVEIVFPP